MAGCGIARPGRAGHCVAKQGEGNMSSHLLFSGKIIGMNDGYRMLIVAIVNQAIVDYKDTCHHSSAAKRAHARHWLSTHGADWLEAVGVPVDQDWWENWISNRCQKHR